MVAGPTLSPEEHPQGLSASPPDPERPDRTTSLLRTRGASSSSVATPVLSPKQSAQSFTSNHSHGSNGTRPSFDRQRRPSFTPVPHTRQLSQAPVVPSLLRANTAGPTTSFSSSATTLNSVSSSSTSYHAPHPSVDRSASFRGAVRPGGASVDLTPASRAQIANGDSSHGLQLPHERRAPSVDVPGPRLAPSPVIPQDRQSVGEFAQEHLFSQFKRQANEKINQYTSSRTADQNPDYVERNFGPGADAKFDTLLTAIGHSASRNPSSFIDKITLWHGEVIENAKDSLRQGDALRSDISRERKTSLAIYLLCRALLEILQQTSSHPLARPELDRLENLIYEHHFRILCLEIEPRPSALQAKWDMLTQVTASLFDLDFESMSFRALRDLKHLHRTLSVKGNSDHFSEMNAVQLLRALRFTINLQCESDIGWSRSCKFIQAIVDLFSDVHGQLAKDSYCKFLGHILLPVAGSSRTDFSQLQWRKLVQSLSERIAQLAGKPKYWLSAFPVQAILACVSADDIFMAKFQNAISSLPAKLRERNNRATALKSMCRLLWVFIYRVKDKPDHVTEVLKDLSRIVFFSNRRYSLSREPSIAEPLVHLIRVIGHRHQDLCFRNIIFPLLNYELISSAKDASQLRPEQLDPDRSVIGIRAFLAVMGDLETGTPPPFPLRFDDERKESILDWSHPTSKNPRNSLPSVSQLSPLQPDSTLDSLSVPVTTAILSDSTREFFLHFCDVLNRIVLVCDAGFGGQAAIDDKYATFPTPKTPIGGTFPRAGKDEAVNLIEDKRAFFELLQNGIHALPRCLSGRPPSLSIVNLLCSGTAHIDFKIASASFQALKSIASQRHAQFVIDKFSNFLFSYDNRCSAVSAGGTLGASHIENTLGLYVQLLQIWIHDLGEKKAKARSAPQGETDFKTAQFGTSDTWTQVDRAECQALFFLCSPSNRVRDFAVQILDLVAQLDAALGHSNPRIISVLQSNSEDVLKPSADNLTVYERSILQRDLMSRSRTSTLITLCRSDHAEGQALWYKVLPHFLDAVHQACPVAVTQTREDICLRLSQMALVLENLDDNLGAPQCNPSIDMTIARAGRNAPTMMTDTLCSQWKAYLIFVCKTMTKPGVRQTPAPASPMPPPAPAPPAQPATLALDTSLAQSHIRKGSKSSQTDAGPMSTGTELFGKVVPFLFAGNERLRDATVIGIANTGINLLRPLLEALETQGRAADRQRPFAHHRSASSPRRHQSTGFSNEVANVHKLVAHHLQLESVRKDEWIMDYFSTYTKDLCMFLHQTTNSNDVLQLRLHFCGLVERFYTAATLTKDPERWMPFQTRRSAFTNMEAWTGMMSPERVRPSENQFQQPSHQQPRDSPRPSKSSAVKQFVEIRNAALSSMAALCAGPLQVNAHNFSAGRMMQWIHKMLNNDSDAINAIGRRALINIIKHNPSTRFPLDGAIDRLYTPETARSLNNYIEVIRTILMENLNHPAMDASKMFTALLYTLTNTSPSIRMTCARLLRRLDEANNAVCKLQDYDMSISDRTPAVYKKAHFDISGRLANAHPEASVAIFAEFSKQFRQLGEMDRSEDQRNLVHAILPWLKNINLQVQNSPSSIPTPTPASYMILMNLLEITLGYSAPLQHEIQALWQTLVNGPHRGNVRFILDFTMDLTLDCKNPELVEVVRQIVVFMAAMPAGEKLMDALLQHIAPSQMQDEDRGQMARVQRPPEASTMFAHVGHVPYGNADGEQAWDMTLGQLSLILLVDLTVAPRKIPAESIPSVLQAVLVLWDHKIPIVQEQAREMLVHLIHELIISEINTTGPVPEDVEIFIELVRQQDSKTVWQYNENERADKGFELSKPFVYVVTELIKTFEIKYPGIAVAWGQVTLTWATTCRALHVALRSLQIYRCIVTPLNKTTVCDLIRVLSGIIADDELERRSYAIEAMRTIRAVLNTLQPTDSAFLSQIFWATNACLGIGQEAEFSEGLPMLDMLLEKLDIGEPQVLSMLLDSKPRGLSLPEGGLTSLALPGVRSSAQLNSTLRVLDRLIRIPANDLVGSDDRLLYVVLANTPRFMQALRSPGVSDVYATTAASALGSVATATGYQEMGFLLDHVAAGTISIKVFAPCLLKVVKAAFYPQHEFRSLLFVMGLLSNRLEYVQSESLAILDVLTDEIDMSNTEIAEAGPDLVSPLLRLLQSDLCPLALRVLDKFTSIASASNGRQQLHMSMANWRSSRAMRKQYDDIQSLFGIPEESGWSIAMPGKLKVTTRENLSRVSTMYAPTALDLKTSMPTPEVDFYKEAATGESYFPDGSMNLTSDEATLAETSMGELMNKLDTLDDFFEDDDTVSDHLTASRLSRSPETTPQPGFPPARSFDDLMPLAQAQSHTRSFQSSFSSSRTRPTTPRENVIMSPSAFKFTPPRNANGGRPGIHRSSTSPAVNQHTPPDRTFAVSRERGEPFSDDDALLSGTTSDASSIYPMPRSRPSLRIGMKNGFRKLTGGGGPGGRRAPSRQMEDSPDVPRVPDVFRNPRSGEM